MTVTSFAAIFYTLTFVIPGFIWASVFDRLVPRRAHAERTQLLRLLLLSSVNYALWSPLIFLMGTGAFFPGRVVPAALAWGAIIGLSPALLGLLTGALSQRGTIRRLFRRLGFTFVHPIPTAWDFVFQRPGAALTLVTFSDGSQVAGFLGQRSFVSSDPVERDLYLEQTYVRSDEGVWIATAFSAGILVRAHDIRHIEFWNLE